MSKRKFPKMSFSRSTSVLELVHSDLMGPMEVQSPTGNRYVFTLIDDYSRYNTIYFLQTKDQAAAKIKEFVALAENQFDTRLKTFRSDGGGEFLCGELKQFFATKAIIHELTVPYNPQQNGIAERRNRYLTEMTRCHLIKSNLAKCYWAEAMNAANYTQNRLAMKSINNKSPFELWFGRKPNLNYFKVFGCRAYIQIAKELRRKLDPKCKEVLFVGYCEHSKGYRFLDIDSGKIVISRDAQFDEGEKVSSSPNDRAVNTVFFNLTSHDSNNHEDIVDDN